MKNVTFHIDRLECPSCAKKIGDLVSQLPDVNKAEVAFTTGRLSVQYAIDDPKLDDVTKLIRRLGYTATPLSS